MFPLRKPQVPPGRKDLNKVKEAIRLASQVIDYVRLKYLQRWKALLYLQ